MASSSSKNSPMESCPIYDSSKEHSLVEDSLEEYRDWLRLPREVTASILSRVGVIEVMTSAQMVCKSWLEISKDPLVWRTIEMCNSKDNPETVLSLDRMCRHAVDRSCGQLVDINIGRFINDDLLKYITDRSSQIKRLRLAFCFNSVTDEGLIEAIAKLPLLEELDLSVCSFTRQTLEAIGRCPRLTSLKLNWHAYRVEYLDPEGDSELNEEAIAIGKIFPEIHHLQLIGNSMTNVGLEVLLDGCRHLESLDLRLCLNIDLSGDLGKRCAEQIKYLRFPNDSLKDCGFDIKPDHDEGLFNEVLQAYDLSSLYYAVFEGRDFDYDDFGYLSD